LLFNKPVRWTSFDVVKKVKYKLKYKYNLKKIKVGHAGTLDPLAEGLMIVCTGKATKEFNKFQLLNKEYIAKIELGKTTLSYDLETEVDKTYETKHINKELTENILKEYIGCHEQIPPSFSAKKLNGKRAYDMARKGKRVDLKPSKIEIKKIKLLDFQLPYIKIFVLCSKGTYIRALARDIGLSLNSGAFLVELKRTAIGSFKLDNAVDINDFEG